MGSANSDLSSASSCGSGSSIQEFSDLVRASKIAAARIESNIRSECERVYDPAAAAIRRLLGKELDGCSALEIGPGQWLAQARYFGRWARVTGIDLDVLPQGFDLRGYVHMLKSNGWRRVAKTLGRKVLGFDRQIVKAYQRVMGPVKFDPRVQEMDATKMAFASSSFDFSYSFNVLEHIPDPGAVFRECARVVRPGGVVFHDLHLYTSDTGCHDPRIISGEREGVAFWPHLRPQEASTVRYGGYLNKISLKDWKFIIEKELPGAEVSYRRDDYMTQELARARAAGELANYSDDELMIRNIVVAWRKP